MPDAAAPALTTIEPDVFAKLQVEDVKPGRPDALHTKYKILTANRDRVVRVRGHQHGRWIASSGDDMEIELSDREVGDPHIQIDFKTTPVTLTVFAPTTVNGRPIAQDEHLFSGDVIAIRDSRITLFLNEPRRTAP